jgi:hypothetical protein
MMQALKASVSFSISCLSLKVRRTNQRQRTLSDESAVQTSQSLQYKLLELLHNTMQNY